MEAYITALIVMVLTMLKASVKNAKSKAKLEAVAFQAYATLLALFPEFADRTQAARMKAAL